MHTTEGNRIAYVLAMATSLSGFAAQALLRRLCCAGVASGVGL